MIECKPLQCALTLVLRVTVTIVQRSDVFSQHGTIPGGTQLILIWHGKVDAAAARFLIGEVDKATVRFLIVVCLWLCF